jgi:hypothetical protein
VVAAVDRMAGLVRLTKKGRGAVRTAIGEIAEIEAKWLDRWRLAGLRGDLRAALEGAVLETKPAAERRPG